MKRFRRPIGVGPFACFAAGVAAAGAIAGCGGNGSVAGKVSSAASASGTRPVATQTRETDVVTRTEVTRTEAATDTQTVSTTTTVTETGPAETVTEGSTVEVTVTAPVQPAPPAVTTTLPGPTTTLAGPTTTVVPASESGGTSPWVWALVAAGAALLIGLVAWLVSRRSRSRGLERRQRALAAAVDSWTAQGWAIESQTSTGAVLRRNEERVAVTVQPDGSVTTQPLAPLIDADPARGWPAREPPPSFEP